jgi:hypothetical protein
MVAMNRYLEKYIQKDLKRKIVLLTGPRQTGKTFKPDGEDLGPFQRPGYF